MMLEYIFWNKYGRRRRVLHEGHIFVARGNTGEQGKKVHRTGGAGAVTRLRGTWVNKT